MNSITCKTATETSQGHTVDLRDRRSEEPFVSVVIPARNAQATLSQTLWSVRLQSHANWELIVVNDGSTDSTEVVVEAHRQVDDRIRLVQGLSQGVSAARNLGASMARGSLVAFLDADDLWLPQKLSAHVAFLAQETEVGLAFDRIQFVDAQARVTSVVSTRRVKGLRTADLLSENPACTASTLVIRKEVFDAIGGFDTQLRHAEDLELMIRIAATTPWRVEGIDRILTRYRTSAAGASADLRKMQEGWERVMAKVETYAPSVWRRHGPDAQAIHLRYLARRALRLGLPAQTGLQWWYQAWQSSPGALLRQPFRSLGTLSGLLVSWTGAWMQSLSSSLKSSI